MARSRKRSKTRQRRSYAFAAGIALGPRRKRRVGAACRRKTTHKRRSIWFPSRAAWPVREARVQTLVNERARAAAVLPPQPGTTQWELIGPTNVGGRMTCAVCLPSDPDTLWAGAAGGGVWKSEDGGRHWRALWHKQATLNIGSLAIDPTDPATLYCGTGEANLSADSYPGVGIYRSIDGGANWQLLAPAETTGIPTRIGSIAIDPFDPAHIRIGGVAHDNAASDGLFVSRNGGLSWGRENFAGPRYRCHTVLFHPSTRDTLFATITARGTRSGIWRSTNGGATWKQLTNGLPSGDAMGRISLAISPSRPSTMYALAENDSDGVLGVFRTTDGGAAWRNVAGDHFGREDQISYGNTIVVHPTNPDLVLCGGVELHRTVDGGKTWRRVTDSFAPRPTAKNYAHADHHCLLMPPAKPDLVYDLNDGGLDVSTDSGKTWVNRSNGLAVTMFYDVDVAQSDGGVYGGGTQDNGTNVTFEDRPDKYLEVDGGDGGWMIVDPQDAQRFYSTSQNMAITRHRGAQSKDVKPPANRAEREAVWMVFLDMDPNDSKTIFAGGLRVWRTRTDGNSWKAVSDILDESPITAVEIARSDSKTIYVGTEKGGIFRSDDGGDSWSGDLSGPVPGFTVTRLFAHPNDANIVHATIANFGASHVFRSKDRGRTWIDIDQHRLPDVPHHAIAIPTGKPSTLYVCGDAGVYVSTDAGGTWKNLTRNLPTVPIVDLVYHDTDDTLTAASYGRSLWRLRV
jgi:photosystem II stability/assembly factor-like uncharacterized protein